MWQRYVIDPLAGRMPLSKAVWIYGVALTLAFLVVEPLFTGSPWLHGLYYGLGIVVGIAQSVILWRCSYNARSPGYGRVLRVLIVAGVLLTLLVLYVVWTHPEIRDLAESGAL